MNFMKRQLIILLLAIISICANADVYNFLNFVRNDGTTQQFAATGAKITFRDHKAVITNGASENTVVLAGLKHLVFGNTEIPSGDIKGDVNGDGTVDIADVNLVLNVMLGTSSLSELPGADVNGDGVADVTDLNLTLNIVLGKYIHCDLIT